MKHQEGTFPGTDGAALYYQTWQADEPAKAIVVLAHGLGEHSGRYEPLAHYLADKGFTLYALDHRGHGRSPGPRGFLKDWSEFREDLRKFILMVREQEGERPFFLYGHSMGGGIAINYALYYPDGLNGLIASAPAVGKLDIPPLLAVMSKALSTIWPGLSFPTGLEAAAISRDEAEVQAYKDDPLVHGIGTPRLGVELGKAAEWSQANAAKLAVPLLMIHGDADRIVNMENSRRFFAAVQEPDKELIIYEGGYHESHNDLQRQQVFADIAHWLEKHV